MNRREYTRLGTTLLLSAIAGSVRAQDYPTRPIQIVVPFPPGGANDILARTLAQQMSERIPGNVIVDNRSIGATGSIGAKSVAAATPDGYTLLLGNTSSLSINTHIYPALKYDPQRDFEPISVIGTSSLVLVVNNAVPAPTLADFVRVLKPSPEKYSYASAGPGSPQHLAGELFKLRTGTSMTHVPYRGTAPAYMDLLSGRVTAMFDNTTTAAQHVRAGNMRALAVTGHQRSPLFPDTPTLLESGFRDIEIMVWFGLVAPRGTPAHIIDRLAEAVSKATQSEHAKKRLVELDIVPWGSTPQEMRAFVAKENSKWSAVVQQANIKVD